MPGRVSPWMQAARESDVTPAVPDEFLAARVAPGDGSAFDELVERWRDRVVDLARLMTGDRDQAEDIGQEVFFRLLRKPEAYDPTRPFRAWIRAVTRNLCLDGYRRRTARDKYQKRAAQQHEFGPTPLPGPAEQAVLSEAQEALRATVAALPRKFREVYVLCAVQGLSYEQASVVCGCGSKTVSTRLARARRKVLERMRKWL